MCRFFLPLWLVCFVLFVGGCGLVWKFDYGFPDKISMTVQAQATTLPSSAWTLTPPAEPTSMPSIVYTPGLPARSTDLPPLAN